MHAYACGLRSRAERVGELLVGEIVREAQADRLELTVRKVGERLVEPLEPCLVGPGRRRFAVESIEDAESCAGTPLEAAAADRRGEDMAGDGEEPGSAGAARLVAEARPRQPRLRERLGCQVVRRVRVSRPAEMEPVDASA